MKFASDSTVGRVKERIEPVVAVEPSEAVVERAHTTVGSSEEVPSGAEALVEPAGFTFIEEDDVAFTLQLCREVHRLYGEYQEGGLPTDDYVLAGLAVTMEMLAVLSGTVTDGMPAMRITVAAAQTREMLAVIFGHDPLDGPLEGRFRAQYRAIVDESARALASQPGPLPDGWAEAALGRAGAPDPVVAAVPAITADTEPVGSTDDSDPSRRSLLRRLFGRRPK